MGGEACDAVTHNIERRDRLTFLRGRERRRWQAKDGAVREEMHEPSAGFSPHKTRPSPLSCRNLRGRDQVAATTKAIRGFVVSIQGRNVSQASASCSVRWAGPRPTVPGAP